MFKHTRKWIVFALFFLLCITISTSAIASNGENNEDSINEKFGLPVVVYGSALTPSQKEEVRTLLGVKDPKMVKELTVSGEDLERYIKGNKHSNMYSSAKITLKDSGSGLYINQVTPENITAVSDEMYANALLTAGIQDAVVDVASPVKVSGHSALVGIYKAYDEGEGTELNTEHTEVANEELSLASKLAQQEGLDKDKISELLTEIKKEIAAQNPATKEDIEKIINEQLKTLEIKLSPEDRQLLIDLFEKMRSLNINFDNVKSQLESLSKDIQSRIEEAVGDKGFLQAIGDFFKNLIEGIKSLFS
ncbi:DUF1002 domain-containing protein [Cytobacillus sp.]|uniref:DUF1002 domain-containing protein n=1 Tax=Cytobacillus sp. TaxID=2675269 RepID=UPI0028BDE760|nr:DUF1002 domain-containing protein [Cytobacillus sp.]